MFFHSPGFLPINRVVTQFADSTKHLPTLTVSEPLSARRARHEFNRFPGKNWKRPQGIEREGIGW